MPVTNLRQVVTLGLVAGTGIAYLGLAIKYVLLEGARLWTPAYEWLGFLALMSGLDGAQFLAKRSTDASYVTAKQSGPSAVTTTTVSGDPPVTVTKTDPT